MPEIRVGMEEHAKQKGNIMSAVVLMDIMGHVAKTVIRFNTLVLIAIIIKSKSLDLNARTKK